MLSTIIIPSWLTDEQISQLNALSAANYVRAEPMPVVDDKPKNRDNWRDKLVKNGVKV